MMKKLPRPLVRVLRGIAVALFWFCVWETFGLLALRMFGLPFLVPTATQTIKRFFELLPTADFLIPILYSIGRIGAGLLCGLVFGILLAFLTHYSKIANALLSPLMTVIRATPVASIIMILWLLLKNGSQTVPFAISMMMVLPVIWQNASNGFASVDQSLTEVASVFSLSPWKRFRLLVLPSLISCLIPAAITSVGLAWKAGIASEIIAYSSHSIGAAIKNAKDSFETVDLFAWTLAVVILSLLFETAIRFGFNRFSRNHLLSESRGSMV